MRSGGVSISVVAFALLQYSSLASAAYAQANPALLVEYARSWPVALGYVAALAGSCWLGYSLPAASWKSAIHSKATSTMAVIDNVLHGFTYNLQDLVTLPYFGAPTSTTVNGWLSFQGAQQQLERQLEGAGYKVRSFWFFRELHGIGPAMSKPWHFSVGCGCTSNPHLCKVLLF